MTPLTSDEIAKRLQEDGYLWVASGDLGTVLDALRTCGLAVVDATDTPNDDDPVLTEIEGIVMMADREHYRRQNDDWWLNRLDALLKSRTSADVGSSTGGSSGGRGTVTQETSAEVPRPVSTESSRPGDSESAREGASTRISGKGSDRDSTWPVTQETSADPATRCVDCGHMWESHHAEKGCEWTGCRCTEPRPALEPERPFCTWCEGDMHEFCDPECPCNESQETSAHLCRFCGTGGDDCERFSGRCMACCDACRDNVQIAHAEPVTQETSADEDGLPDSWPDRMEMIAQLRRVVGLFDGAMSISPKRAWEEALKAADPLASWISPFPGAHPGPQVDGQPTWGAYLRDVPKTDEWQVRWARMEWRLASDEYVKQVAEEQPETWPLVRRTPHPAERWTYKERTPERAGWLIRDGIGVAVVYYPGDAKAMCDALNAVELVENEATGT